jgi:hypothetical protein
MVSHQQIMINDLVLAQQWWRSDSRGKKPRENWGKLFLSPSILLVIIVIIVHQTMAHPPFLREKFNRQWSGERMEFFRITRSHKAVSERATQ